MSERGFIAVARGILDHPVIGAEKPYCRTVAWLWLLLEAAYKPHRVRVTNGRAVEFITLERGQLSHSQSFLAKAWGWSEKRVRTFLGQLEKEGQIALQTGGLQTVLTVCKYDEYQFPRFSSDGQSEGQSDGRRTRKGREEEQRNKETKKNPPAPSAEPDGFGEFYAAYPRKEARKAAARAYAKVVPSQISAGGLLERTKCFAREWAGRPRAEHKFCPLPASWLNGGRFLDETVAGSPAQEARSPAGHAPIQSPDEFTDGEWMDCLELLRDGEPWAEKIWGPPPGQPGCRVPTHLVNNIAPPHSRAISAASPIKDRRAA